MKPILSSSSSSLDISSSSTSFSLKLILLRCCLDAEGWTVVLRGCKDSAGGVAADVGCWREFQVDRSHQNIHPNICRYSAGNISVCSFECLSLSLFDKLMPFYINWGFLSDLTLGFDLHWLVSPFMFSSLLFPYSLRGQISGQILIQFNFWWIRDNFLQFFKKMIQISS